MGSLEEKLVTLGATHSLLETEGHSARLWPHVDREVYPHRAKRYMELEQRAARMREFTAFVMPGLFRSPQAFIPRTRCPSFTFVMDHGGRTGKAGISKA